jgi:hypothetical protein|nr:MAG TPA: hypothetical protein [Caudoviricetes sp.]
MIIYDIHGYTQLRRLLAMILTARPTELKQLAAYDYFWHNGTKWTLWDMEKSKGVMFPLVTLVKWGDEGIFVFPNTLLDSVSTDESEILTYLDFLDLFE